jgi:GNAT superfamily N-acetyltransferase
MSFEIKEVKVDTELPNLIQLFVKHREEIITDKSLMVLNPDFNNYYELEKKGRLILLCVYLNNKVIGYSCNFLINHLHCKDLLMSQNDLLFLDNSYRKSKIGLQLIKETEKVCKSKGSKLHVWNTKQNSTFNKLLEKKGYKIQEILYSKEL